MAKRSGEQINNEIMANTIYINGNKPIELLIIIAN